MSYASDGIQFFNIILDSECFDDPWIKPNDRGTVLPAANVYKPGTQLRGTLRIAVTKPVRCNGLFISAQGHMCAGWDEDSTVHETLPSPDTVIDNCSRKTYSVKKDYLILARKQLYVCDATQCLPPGDHHFPFALDIPATIPSSFHGRFGVIRYWMDVYLDRHPYDFNVKKTEEIILHGEWDMSGEHSALMSFQKTGEETYCCWCCAGGTFGYTIDLHKKGFSRGEEIAPSLQLYNYTDSECVTTIELKRRIVYKSGDHKFTSEKETVNTVEKRENPQSSSMWVPRFDVLSHWPPSKLYGCDEISFEYSLRLLLSPEGCNCDSSTVDIDIYIGELPEGLHSVPFVPPQNFPLDPTQPVLHAPIDLTRGITTNPETQALLPKGNVNAYGDTQHASWYPRPSAPVIEQPQARFPIGLENDKPPPPSYSECIQLSTMTEAGPPPGAQYGIPQGASAPPQPATGYQYSEPEKNEKTYGFN